jgi:catechol 2,3-dioxygenase-like lactoylglutathione lyase family enzyme
MIKDINILGFYVSDISTTVNFYSKLGFQTKIKKERMAEMSLGTMTLQFIDKETAKEQSEAFQKEAFGEPKGTGLYINIEVDAIDEYYQSLKDRGLSPSSSPKDWLWGHREFVIRDPDRYKLVFYQKV